MHYTIEYDATGSAHKVLMFPSVGKLGEILLSQPEAASWLPGWKYDSAVLHWIAPIGQFNHGEVERAHKIIADRIATAQAADAMVRVVQIYRRSKKSER